MQLNETMENLHEINVLQIIFQTDMQKYCRNSSILSPEANPKAICFGRFHEIVDMTGEFQNLTLVNDIWLRLCEDVIFTYSV